MKHKKINTRYDQFGGHSSEIRSTILLKGPSKTNVQSFRKADSALRAEIVRQIDELYVGKAKQHLIKCAERIQKARVKLKARSAAGEKIEWTKSCWPFGIEARCRSWDSKRDIEAIHVALGSLHDEHQAGNKLIPKKIHTICPGLRLDPYSQIKDSWIRTDLQSLLRHATADLEKRKLRSVDTQNGKDKFRHKCKHPITLRVAVKQFMVSRSTIMRLINNGKLKSYRPKNHSESAAHIVDAAEIAGRYTRRTKT